MDIKVLIDVQAETKCYEPYIIQLHVNLRDFMQ